MPGFIQGLFCCYVSPRMRIHVTCVYLDVTFRLDAYSIVAILIASPLGWAVRAVRARGAPRLFVSASPHLLLLRSSFLSLCPHTSLCGVSCAPHTASFSYPPPHTSPHTSLRIPLPPHTSPHTSLRIPICCCSAPHSFLSLRIPPSAYLSLSVCTLPYHKHTHTHRAG